MEREMLSDYPELAQRIGALCQGANWCITGVSALIHDERAFYFEITKPKHWIKRRDGATQVGLGGVGGSLEPDETILECLAREVHEELLASIQIEPAGETFVVYEQRVIDTVSLSANERPTPILVTVSQNLYRREILPECQMLAIVTFLARLKTPPALGDLLGWAAIPADMLEMVLSPDEIESEQLTVLPSMQIVTQTPLPPNTMLKPVWTARSLQVLLQNGRWPHSLQSQRSRS